MTFTDEKLSAQSLRDAENVNEHELPMWNLGP